MPAPMVDATVLCKEEDLKFLVAVPTALLGSGKEKTETFIGSRISSVKSDERATTQAPAFEGSVIKKQTRERSSASYPDYVSGWERAQIYKFSELL